MINAFGDIETTVEEKYPHLEWLVPLLLCTILWAQLLLTGRQLSQTADEATHLYSGYRYLKCGDLTISPEHPPFAKAIAASVMLAMKTPVDCGATSENGLNQAFASAKWFYMNDWPKILPRARAAISVFTVGLCLLVWILARRLFGFATAVAACLIILFEPNVLAFGSLVMTDVPVTCMLLLAVLGFYLWAEHRQASFLVLTGVAVGLALLTKISGVAVVPILGVLGIVDAFTSEDKAQRWQRLFRNLAACALIYGFAFAIVWAVYGTGVSGLSGETDLPPAAAAAISGSVRVMLLMQKCHLLPPAYVRAVAIALMIPGSGSVAFVAGKVYPHAPWFATLFNFVIRNTASMLVMLLAATGGMLLAPRNSFRERLFVLIPPALYLAMCVYAGSNLGMRYLVPVLPFLVILVAHGCLELTRRVSWFKYALVFLIVAHAASSLWTYPNYLSYANELWGGPKAAYKYLPWVDIGQAYPEARAYLQQHPSENCWMITGWQWDPAVYGVPCKTTGLYLSNTIPARVRGRVIVSSTLVDDVRLPEGTIATAFKGTRPVDSIGGSALLVYEGDFDTRANASIGERNLAAAASIAGQTPAALEHEEKAVRLAPGSPIAHADLCSVLARDRVDLALQECTTARNLLAADPLSEEEGRQRYLHEIDAGLTSLHKRYKLIYGDNAVGAGGR